MIVILFNTGKHCDLEKRVIYYTLFIIHQKIDEPWVSENRPETETETETQPQIFSFQLLGDLSGVWCSFLGLGSATSSRFGAD